MVTFCKFSQKYFIRFVFFLSSTGDNLSPLHPTHHQPHPAQINLSQTISTPTFSAPPERKCQKKLQTYPTFALRNPHSLRAARQNLPSNARLGVAYSPLYWISLFFLSSHKQDFKRFYVLINKVRPPRRGCRSAAGPVICCRAAVLMMKGRPGTGGCRPAAGLPSCCLAGDLPPGR